MQAIRAIVVLAAAMLGSCGNAGSGGESVAASQPRQQGPQARAVTKSFSVEMDKLIVDEKTYVDGLAMRFENGAAAALTEAPISACTRLAVVAQSQTELQTSALAEKPVLMLVRNEEHPNGAILLVEPYSTTTLEDAFPALVTEGNELIAKGDVGDAGWGSIDATKYGAEGAPHVRLDVSLPYAKPGDIDPVAADASAEAKWLRDMRAKAAPDTQATVDASLQVDPDDYSGSVTSNAWFDLLANWANFNVVAVATDQGCATLVVREPGFVGGYREAIIQTRLVDNERKVTSIQTESKDSIDDHYAFGRVEQTKLGAFPILHGRAAREEGVGLVVYLSDKPVGEEPFETLVTKQRMLRAVASSEYGDQYSFSHYDLGGPGVAPEQISAGNSTTNPHLDDKEIAGLIKLEDGDGPRIAVNFQLALGGQGN